MDKILITPQIQTNLLIHSFLPYFQTIFASHFNQFMEILLLTRNERSCMMMTWLTDLNKERRILFMKQTIRIKYFTDKIEKLTYIDGKSDWIDLRAADNVSLKKSEFALIPLGIAMELPAGYEAHVVPRSSTFKNFGVIQTNHMGVIDESYCGDNDQWFMPVLAVRDTEIHVNDRICQFRIMEHQPTISFEECTTLNGTDRGGFGSTGRA